jgi:hypothetical protein
MKLFALAVMGWPIAIASGLVSCGAMGEAGRNSVALVQKSTATAGSKVAHLTEMASSTVRPARIKVVEVREKDLKKLPTGHEQAMAYESSRRRSWFFSAPIDFREPSLPTDGVEADGTLLPTLSE